MPENRPLRVFLCHSSNDKPTVRELHQRLKAEGWIDPWLDKERLYPGQNWNLEIEKAVEAADAILVCLSNNSITKEGYVQRELRVVLDYADYKPEGTLYLIPIRLEDCEPPRRLRPWQYADYFEKDRERAYQRLLVSLRMRAKSLGISVEKPQVQSVSEKPKPEPKRENVEPRPTTQQDDTGERFLIRGEISLDMHTRRLKMRGQIVDIPPTTFDYLVVLARHAPNLVGYQTLIAEAKGYQADFREAQQQVKWHMHRIRQALKTIESNPSKPIYLINQRGVGYRLVTD